MKRMVIHRIKTVKVTKKDHDILKELPKERDFDRIEDLKKTNAIGN